MVLVVDLCFQDNFTRCSIVHFDSSAPAASIGHFVVLEISWVRVLWGGSSTLTVFSAQILNDDSHFLLWQHFDGLLKARAAG